jgi:hypothetical protein
LPKRSSVTGQNFKRLQEMPNSCSPTFSTKFTYNIHQYNRQHRASACPSTSFLPAKVIFSGRTQANSICQPSAPILHAMLPFLLESLRFLHKETSKQRLPAPPPLWQNTNKQCMPASYILSGCKRYQFVIQRLKFLGKNTSKHSTPFSPNPLLCAKDSFPVRVSQFSLVE